MSYPVKYRERVIGYRQEGHTLEETSRIFKVAISTIWKWENQIKETGNLTPKVPKRSFKKIDPLKLIEYVAQHSDAYQKEIAREFGCAQSAVNKAFKRLHITRKKSKTVSGTKLRKSRRI